MPVGSRIRVRFAAAVAELSEMVEEENFSFPRNEGWVHCTVFSWVKKLLRRVNCQPVLCLYTGRLKLVLTKPEIDCLFFETLLKQDLRLSRCLSRSGGSFFGLCEQNCGSGSRNLTLLERCRYKDVDDAVDIREEPARSG